MRPLQTTARTLVRGALAVLAAASTTGGAAAASAIVDMTSNYVDLKYRGSVDVIASPAECAYLFRGLVVEFSPPRGEKLSRSVLLDSFRIVVVRRDPAGQPVTFEERKPLDIGFKAPGELQQVSGVEFRIARSVAEQAESFTFGLGGVLTTVLHDQKLTAFTDRSHRTSRVMYPMSARSNARDKPLSGTGNQSADPCGAAKIR